jgi:iron(III) transport system substrate-binding protein
MPNRPALVGAVFAAIAALLGPQRASADGKLVLYCAVKQEWCRNMVAAFERQTGIKVAMTRKSSGEFYAQVQAEASNPRGDIWVGRHGRPTYAGGRRGPDDPI